MKTVYFIRHGDVFQPDPEHPIVYYPDTPLSDRGKGQLSQLGQELKDRGVQLEALFHSPYRRAFQSAEIIREILGIKTFIKVDDLRDVDPNSWEGEPLTEYGKHKGDIYSNTFVNEKGPRPQETLIHLQNRGLGAFRFIMESNNFENIGVVSHGDLLGGLIFSLTNPGEVLRSYEQITNTLYLKKGEAWSCKIEGGRLVGEGKLITVSSVTQTVEGFRGKER